jgi:hypothetical protein
MSDENSSPEEDPELDDFLEKVGQESDPVKYFFNALKECGCDVEELPNGSFNITKACPNLVTHTSNGFCEILCTKCFIALDIHPIELPEIEVKALEDEEDDIDAFLRIAGTEVNTSDYPKSKKARNEISATPFEFDDFDVGDYPDD